MFSENEFPYAVAGAPNALQGVLGLSPFETINSAKDEVDDEKEDILIEDVASEAVKITNRVHSEKNNEERRAPQVKR